MSAQPETHELSDLFKEKRKEKEQYSSRPDLKPDPLYTSLRRQKVVVNQNELPYWDGVTKLKVTKSLLQRTVDDTRSLCNLAMWDGLTEEEFNHALIVAKVNARKFDQLCGVKTKLNVSEMLVTCLPGKDGTANCFVMPATGATIRQFSAEKSESLMKVHRAGIRQEANERFGQDQATQKENFIAFREETAPTSLRRQTTHQAPQVPVIDLKAIPRIEI